VEHARKLVESDEVALHVQPARHARQFGDGQVPDLEGRTAIAIVSGSNKFTNVADFPLTTTSLVSFDTEGKNLRQVSDQDAPNAKYAILYQNDDLGKDYVNAFKALLKSDFDKRVVTAAYEINDPTVDSQVVN